MGQTTSSSTISIDRDSSSDSSSSYETGSSDSLVSGDGSELEEEEVQRGYDQESVSHGSSTLESGEMISSRKNNAICEKTILCIPSVPNISNSDTSLLNVNVSSPKNDDHHDHDAAKTSFLSTQMTTEKITHEISKYEKELTFSNILQTSREIAQQTVCNSAASAQETNVHKWYFHNSDGEEVLNDASLQNAIVILSVSQNMRQLRFRMVPAKLSEARFWNTVFHILDSDTAKSRPQSQSQSSQHHDHSNASESTSDHADDSKSNNSHLTIDATNRKEDEMRNISVEKQLETALEKIHYLERELEQQKLNNTKLSTTTTIPMDSSPATNHNNIIKKKNHKGNWVMDKECKEFLELDETLKQNLREGKQKRLKEVLDQMKFILDSDSLQDTTGYWDCCKANSYIHPCVCTN